MIKSVILKSLHISALLLVLLHCETNNVVSTIEKPHGNFIGKVCDIHGKPVEGATVLLVSENYLPNAYDKNQATVNKTRTEASGYFAFDVEQSGKYNLLANNQKHFLLRKGIPVKSSKQIELPQEQLLEPGSLSGSLHMEGMHNHQSAVILLIGTNLFASPNDTSGNFYITDLAEGEYKLQFMSKESGFGVVETTITVRSEEMMTLPAVTIPRSRIATIDNFDIAFDPFMMSAELIWTTNDTDIIDSFYIYCNRKYNFFPVSTTPNTVFSTLIDLIGFQRDTLTFQIVPIMHNGKEGVFTTGTPFINKSAVNVDTILSSFLTSGYKTLHHFSKKGHYIVEGLSSNTSRITKLDADFAITQQTDIEGCLTMTKYYNMGKYYNSYGRYNVMGTDKQGNFYMIIQKCDSLDSTEIVKLDTNFTISKRYSLPPDSGWPFYSIAVSSSGSVMLFKHGEYSHATTAIIFNHELNKISELHYDDYRIITNYFFSNDTVCVKINKGPQDVKYDKFIFLYYDNLFNEVGSININDMEAVEPFPMKLNNIDKFFSATMVSHNLIFSRTYQTTIDQSLTIYYLLDTQGTIKARTEAVILKPFSDYDNEFYIDNNGYLYNYSKYKGSLIRYKIAE